MNEMHPMGERQQGQKSSRGKGKYKPKGRMLDTSALAEVQGLLGEITQRDMLIEYLHVIQDTLRPSLSPASCRTGAPDAPADGRNLGSCQFL